MAQQRAQKGGQVGANGEWYEGGKFIATTDHAKSKRAAVRATGRQQIEPGKFEVPPAGMRSIYQRWSGLWVHGENGVKLNPGARAEYFGADQLAEAAEAATKYNNGERWYAA